MAIYEYACPVCGTFEVFQRMSEPPLTVCPECAKNGVESKVERLISASGFILKGGGWYKTDYASSSGSSSNGHHHGKTVDTGTKSDSRSRDGGSSDSGSKDSGSKEEAKPKKESSGESKAVSSSE